MGSELLKSKLASVSRIEWRTKYANIRNNCSLTRFFRFFAGFVWLSFSGHWNTPWSALSLIKSVRQTGGCSLCPLLFQIVFTLTPNIQRPLCVAFILPLFIAQGINTIGDSPNYRHRIPPIRIAATPRTIAMNYHPCTYQTCYR